MSKFRCVRNGNSLSNHALLNGAPHLRRRQVALLSAPVLPHCSSFCRSSRISRCVVSSYRPKCPEPFRSSILKAIEDEGNNHVPEPNNSLVLRSLHNFFER